MKSLLLHYSHGICMIFAVVSGLWFDANAQGTGKDISLSIPRICWVRQWPSADNTTRNEGFKNRFNAVVLGKKEPVLTRPVSVFAVDSSEFWILDQESRALFDVQGKVGEIPHFIKKSKIDLSSLVGSCRYSQNGFLVTDSYLEKIFAIYPDKKKIVVLNDSLQLDQPTGIAFSPETKSIWVVETGAHRITVLNEKGEVVKRIGKRGTADGEFNYPTYIWIDKGGLVYIVDAMNFRIQVLKETGEVVSVFGKAGDASGYFARPKGISTDSHGNIYIVDALFHLVQAFDISGKYLGSLGQQGHGEGEFWLPSGIFIDDNDYAYVADSYNSRVQIFQLVFGNEKNEK
jgi:DNA-binding beta-propeller fold protein YncE